jgi:hypothetical protein
VVDSEFGLDLVGYHYKAYPWIICHPSTVRRIHPFKLTHYPESGLQLVVAASAFWVIPLTWKPLPRSANSN